VTFGFQSAIDIATDAIGCIHTTAASHSRVFIVEVMGHKVGWLTLYAGIAGGADVILLPEIPYDLNKVIEAIERRSRMGKRFSVLAVAEGAISKEDAKLSKKEYKAKMRNRGHSTISYDLAAQIEERTGKEVRVAVPGHTQRGGPPCAFDRVLCTRLGAAAVELIMKDQYGYCVGIVKGETKKIPLQEVAGKLKAVDPESKIIEEAKTVGISFGD
jgi:6-phosphofructokinase 1